jgi:uncharacterized membrane protein
MAPAAAADGTGELRWAMRRHDLSTPRPRGRIGIHYDPDAFGNFSEGVARFIGTARFLIYQTVVCIVWVSWNYLVPPDWKFDPYPFQFLTLALSLQAAYAAPLILLAQNRQEERDRQQTEFDRGINARTQSDTEYLARELASVRLALSDVVTTEDLRDHLGGLTSAMERIVERLDEVEFIARDVSPEPSRRGRGRVVG